MRHNVLMVINMKSEYSGNLISSLQFLERRLVADGGMVAYAFPTQPRQPWMEKLQYVYFYDNGIGSMWNMLKMCIKEHNIDIVHYHFGGSLKVLLMNKLYLRNRVKRIYHIHNHMGTPKGTLRKIKTVVIRYLYHGRNDVAVGVSEGVSDSLRSYGVKDVRTIINAIDPQRLEISHEQELIKSRDGITNVMIFGNHYERKGVDFAAKAVQRLNEGGCTTHLYVVSFPRFFPEIKDYIIENSSEVNFKSNVTLLPAVEDIATYYNQTDVFISPSREEGFTYSIIEAAYCGCSVVASAISGQNENTIPMIRWIGDPNETGDTVDELTYAIAQESRKRRDKQYVSSLGSARSYIQEYYGLDQWADQVVTLYGE